MFQLHHNTFVPAKLGLSAGPPSNPDRAWSTGTSSSSRLFQCRLVLPGDGDGELTFDLQLLQGQLGSTETQDPNFSSCRRWDQSAPNVLTIHG